MIQLFLEEANQFKHSLLKSMKESEMQQYPCSSTLEAYIRFVTEEDC